MKITRVCGDADGETRLVAVEVDWRFDAPIPALAIRMGRWRGAEDLIFHPAPMRAMVVPMSGEIEIGATNGDRRRFRPGEWVLVDDLGTRGHTTEGFGPDVQMLHCALPEDWRGWRPQD